MIFIQFVPTLWEVFEPTSSYSDIFVQLIKKEDKTELEWEREKEIEIEKERGKEWEWEGEWEGGCEEESDLKVILVTP